MKTKIVLATLVLTFSLLGSCAHHHPKPAPPPITRQTPVASSHPDYCPHCARRLTDPPVNPTYGPAAYEDNTPPKSPDKQPQTATSSSTVVTKIAAATADIPVPPSFGSVPATVKPVPQLSVDVDGSKYYSIVSGDSLWKTAKAFGVSIDAIKSANALESDVVVVGQKLTIPQE